MDISTPLIFVAIFIIACLSLFLVYKFGIKEKSYEEALAEQRQQTNALLGVKPKPKEKKNKKAAKKSKEKPIPQGNETDESENVDAANTDSQQNKLHVEFKEEPEEVVPVKEVVQVKLKRVKKVRPILVKKDISPEKVILDVVETPIANHFEENPPKDEFELLRSNSRDDIFKREEKEKVVTEKEKVTKEKKVSVESQPPAKTNKKSAKQQSTTNNIVEVIPVVVEKEKEVVEKVIETVTVLPQTNGVVGNPGKEKKKKKSEYNTKQQLTAERDGLINSVRKAELSKSEVQLLIDLLLNKQLEAPAVIGDWSEGKSDPVQKLKKQLAEKEKALAEEQEALAGVQAKLREVRAEQLSEKVQLHQKIKGFEEALQAKQIEMQANNNRLQVNTQKIQQLQAELNAEIVKNQRLLEDNAALQMQMQQFEVRISQVQETDGIVAKLRGDVDELSAQNQQLRIELQQHASEKDLHQQNFLIQLNNVEKGHKQQIQQLEEAHKEMERNLELALRQENDWKIEISNLNSAIQQQFEETRRLELVNDQLREELRLCSNEKNESAKIIAQLNSELQQLQDEQESQVNGSSEESKAHEVEILNLTNELSSVRNKLSSIKSELQQTEKKYKTELESSDKKYSKIQGELEEQKAKNNKLTGEIRSKEQEAQKQFIERLFPEIEGLQAVTSEDWQAEFGRLIKNYVTGLKKQEKRPPSSPEKSQDVVKLQAQLQHYKNIIDDTEGMLNKLQAHIETEEINWRNQLAAKESEIEHLKEKRLSQLQTKVINLEQQISQEISEKKQVLQECQQLKGQLKAHSESKTTIQKLSEEVNVLKEQLRVEQSKHVDPAVILKAHNSCIINKPTNGPAFIHEVPTIRNTSICSNMGCQFLYCDGKSCHEN